MRQDIVREQLNDWYAHVAQKPCIFPGCGQTKVELHHVQLFRSEKTGLPLPRRIGINKAAVIPLCSSHHRTGPDAAHNFGESDWLVRLDDGNEETVRDLVFRWMAEWVFRPVYWMTGEPEKE